MLHLGAVTYEVLKDWDLETIVRNLEAAGFDAVELRTGHRHGVEPSLGTAERDRVRKRFENSKVRLLSLGSTCEFHSPDADVRKRNVEVGKQFVDLAHDTGAWGVKVRPNGFPKNVPRDVTIGSIGASLRELGDYGAGHGIEIWLEVHGDGTQFPSVAADIMKATRHKSVGLCWNSNPPDVVNGSVKQSWDLLRPWVRNAHIAELADSQYPWRELFALMQQSGYDRYTLCEARQTTEPERFLRWYKALWTELTRPCARAD
jgi:hypothetical protein